MAKVFFEGLQRLDFDTQDGKHIDGYNFHIAYPDEGTIGRYTDRKFVSIEMWNNLGFSLDELSKLVQHDVELETNIKGKITGVSPVGKST